MCNGNKLIYCSGKQAQDQGKVPKQDWTYEMAPLKFDPLVHPFDDVFALAFAVLAMDVEVRGAGIREMRVEPLLPSAFFFGDVEPRDQRQEILLHEGLERLRTLHLVPTGNVVEAAKLTGLIIGNYLGPIFYTYSFFWRLTMCICARNFRLKTLVAAVVITFVKPPTWWPSPMSSDVTSLATVRARGG